MTNRAIAGTASVTGFGVRILRERVVNHYSRTQTTAEPEFSELVGIDLVEDWPGAMNDAKITFLREAR